MRLHMEAVTCILAVRQSLRTINLDSRTAGSKTMPDFGNARSAREPPKTRRHIWQDIGTSDLGILVLLALRFQIGIGDGPIRKISATHLAVQAALVEGTLMEAPVVGGEMDTPTAHLPSMLDRLHGLGVVRF
jgi:hypothetical protein